MLLTLVNTSYLHIASWTLCSLTTLVPRLLHAAFWTKDNKICWAFALCWPLGINYFLSQQRSRTFWFKKYKNSDCHTYRFVPTAPGSGHTRNKLLSLSQGPSSFLQVLARLMSFLILQNFAWSVFCTLVTEGGEEWEKRGTEKTLVCFSCEGCNCFFLGESTNCMRESCSSSFYIYPPPSLFSWLFF